MATGLEILKAGALDLLVDRGRFGLRDRGVGPGGPADRWSFALTNALAGNRPEGNAGGLEFALVGPRLKALSPVALALGGGVENARVVLADGTTRSVAPWSSFPLHTGEELILGPVTRGMRGYLAARGGMDGPVVAGSRQSLQPLKSGDLLPVSTVSTERMGWRHVEAGWAEPSREGNGFIVRVLAGPQWQALGWTGPESGVMAVGDRTDRMGIRLLLEEPGAEPPAGLLSEPVCPGVVQAPSKKEWIILGVGCQTLGGYAKVGQVIEADLDLVGQLRPGDRVRMRVVTLAEATEANRLYRRELEKKCQVAIVSLGQVGFEGS